jgi:hypothetical protein
LVCAIFCCIKSYLKDTLGLINVNALSGAISMNKNLGYYLFAIGVFVLLKFWFGTFENDKLTFLLKPTNAMNW